MESSKELSILDIVNVLIRRIWVVALCTILSLSGAFLVSTFLIVPQYTSSAQLYVSPNRDDADNTGNLTDLQYSQRLVNSYLIILRNNLFMQQVAERSELEYAPSHIRSMLTMTSINNTEIFEVKIECEDPGDAFTLVNAIIDLAPEEIIRIRQNDTVRLVSPATFPLAPSSPNIIMNSIIGALIGLAASVGLVILLETLDTRIKSEEELVARFDIPVVGTIPKFEEE
jgi:capsular polysaccharide biosynthesis protein